MSVALFWQKQSKYVKYVIVNSGGKLKTVFKIWFVIYIFSFFKFFLFVLKKVFHNYQFRTNNACLLGSEVSGIFCLQFQ